MLGLTDDLPLPIGGVRGYELFYDIWSNIHYSYVGTAGRSCRWECAVWLYRARYGPFLAWLSLGGAGEVDQARLGEEWLRIKGM